MATPVVSGNKEDGYTFACPLDKFGREPKKGSNLGMCEFVSKGWKTKQQAEERASQHLTEHATGDAMVELVEVQEA